MISLSQNTIPQNGSSSQERASKLTSKIRFISRKKI